MGNNWQSRTETASTPHLIDNGGKSRSIDEEKLKHERQQRIRLNRSAICFDNIRWICAFLNSVILVGRHFWCIEEVSVMKMTWSMNFLTDFKCLVFWKCTGFHFLAGDFVASYEKQIVHLLGSFILRSFIFLVDYSDQWFLSFVESISKSQNGMYIIIICIFLLKIFIPIFCQQHAYLTLTFCILALCTIFLQNSAQQSIESDVETQMRSSLASDNEDFAKDSWDYFHNTVWFIRKFSWISALILMNTSIVQVLRRYRYFGLVSSREFQKQRDKNRKFFRNIFLFYTKFLLYA